jgi:hypothetical protein
VCLLINAGCIAWLLSRTIPPLRTPATKMAVVRSSYSILALIALRLKWALFCLPFATLSHYLAHAQSFISLVALCCLSSGPSVPDPRDFAETAKVSSRQLVECSIIAAHVASGTPACRLSLAIQTRQAWMRATACLDVEHLGCTTYIWLRHHHVFSSIPSYKL